MVVDSWNMWLIVFKLVSLVDFLLVTLDKIGAVEVGGSLDFWIGCQLMVGLVGVQNRCWLGAGWAPARSILMGLSRINTGEGCQESPVEWQVPKC